jgi:hypothetical protein
VPPGKTRLKKADEPLEIVVEIPIGDEKAVLRERVPKGFPPELTPHLADFMERGFRAARALLLSPYGQPSQQLPSIVDLAESARGRPMDDETEREGREGAKLRRSGLTFGQMARQVCRYRSKPAHRCKKQCNDRIRQAVKTYQIRQYLERLSRGEE